MQIKFRAWDKNRKTMLIPAMPLMYGGISWMSNDELCFDPLCLGTYELMQYTGVNDRYGNELYVGDIVKDEKGRVGEIEYVPEHAAFLVRTIDGDGQCYQRLEAGNGKNLMATIKTGNIWDNPELLEVR